MTPTRLRLLLLLALLAAVAGWAVTRLVDTFASRSLPVPWTATVVMGVLALALLLWALGTRSRLSGRPGTRPMDPIVAARTAALAMAGSRTGAIVSGFYLGVALGLAPGWDVEYVRTQAIAAGVTSVVSLLVVAVSLWLERICRLPPDLDDTTP